MHQLHVLQCVLAKPGNSWQEKLFITFQELREDAKIITNKARIIHIIDQEPQICSTCSFSKINEPPKKRGHWRFFQRVRFNKRMSLYKQANILTTKITAGCWRNRPHSITVDHSRHRAHDFHDTGYTERSEGMQEK